MVGNKLLLKGIPASPGRVLGKVFVYTKGKEMPENFDVLVTVLTDPTMIGLILKAKAIVTDIGGITSHPAILSREMGIPCIVNTKNATKLLKDGMKVIVDGNKGVVYEA